MLLAGIGALKWYDKEATDYAYKNPFYNFDTNKLHVVKADTAKNRDKKVISSNANDWVRVKYLLPSEASFEVQRKEGGWFVGNEPTDSTRTWYFLNSLDTVMGTTFLDGVSPYVLYKPEYELDLFNRTGDSIKVECFVRQGQLFLRSSQNPTAVFDARADSLFEKVYVGKARFFPKK